jgi:hypothetical protein
MNHTKAGLLMFLLSILVPAMAQSEAVSAGTWAQMTARDLAFMRATIAEQNIYAFIGDESFAKSFAKANADADAATPDVKNVEGYIAVLRRYMGTQQDPHSRVRFTVEPASYSWPSFLVRRVGNHYRVVASQTQSAPDGAEVTDCDGLALDEIADHMAPLEGTVPGLQATRAAMARLMMVERNPLYQRPTACTIGGAKVVLAWTPVAADALAISNAKHAAFKDETVSSEPFPPDGVWIRLGVFQANSAQAAQYRTLYAALPKFRNKRFIVIDVRGNSGGSYNWFVGFLRALYGTQYSQYYARARLKIRSMFESDPARYAAAARETSDADAVQEPPDPQLNTEEARFEAVRLPNGRTVYELPSVPDGAEPTTPPPPSLVSARVLVLTDNGCASACISFVDEMLRFPGVQQIGAETFVDRLSGTPVTFQLPSGNGNFTAPSMIRLQRERGDNEPRRPSVSFDGDLADTAAVKAWILSDILRLPGSNHTDRGHARKELTQSDRRLRGG